MTDNITKLYELAGVEKNTHCNRCQLEDNGNCSTFCLHYGDDTKDYPPLTAEKQLELIKWIQLLDNVDNLQQFHHALNNRWCFIVEFLPEFSNIPTERLHCSHEQSDQALASLVTNLWHDLTDEQKAEVKRILE